MQDFTSKTVMVTGGTGSFGSTILRYLLDRLIREIRIVGRYEKDEEDLLACGVPDAI